MSLSDHTMMPVGLDHVMAMAVSIGDVTEIRAQPGEAGWGPDWTVTVRGERKYRITFSAEGKGSTLDIACREAIHKLERVKEER